MLKTKVKNTFSNLSFGLISLLFCVLLSGCMTRAATCSCAHKDSLINHVVICWLKGNTPKEEIEMVISETKKLADISGIISLKVGEPVQSDRDNVDDSFTFAAFFKFKNKQDMDAYLTNEKHVEYLKNILKPRLLKLTAYDFTSR